MAQARKKPVAAEAAAKPVKAPPAPREQKRILGLENEVTRLRRTNDRLDRELTSALDHGIRLQETVKVLSGLLTELDSRELARRQIDDNIPF